MHMLAALDLPTYGSWLHWIESEFAALRHFALNGTDHRTHKERQHVIAPGRGTSA
ncbi:hypothetical protein ACFVWZ_09335 [Streptomyces sp. NPDC058200]|uniref:hypothetical protein n=1 Tax=Streptomyces sp. NPDC058200 TaxID=3346378 RepID=UPI0036E3F775